MASNAELFTDALAARRWHQRNNPRGVVPADLEEDAIRSKYLCAVIATNERSILFLDESIATHIDGKWLSAS